MSDKPDGSKPDALLGDLESIRTLLQEEEEAAGSAEDSSEVPLLDDVVTGGMNLDDEPFGHPGEMDTEDGRIGLDEAQFNALLGDDWKASADQALEIARETIENHATEWSPEDTDELNEALRVRIDETIYQWTRQMIHNHIDELRAEVLNVLSNDLKDLINERLKNNDGS